MCHEENINVASSPMHQRARSLLVDKFVAWCHSAQRSGADSIQGLWYIWEVVWGGFKTVCAPARIIPFARFLNLQDIIV